jgi:transposase
MLNLADIKQVYLATGSTDLRKSIDGLSAIVCQVFELDPFLPSLFVFCNRKKDKLKILHWDNGFWLYYRRLEQQTFRWPMQENEALCISMDELAWLLKGYEVRQKNKFKPVIIE